MKKATWQPLKPGDTVDIVAPASDCSKYELNQACRFLEKFGLVPRVPRGLFSDQHLFCSNSDSKRFMFLQKALRAKDSKAIWSIRGGYGCARLLPMLGKMREPGMVKPFLGYSDNTIIHMFLHERWGWPSLHSSVLAELGRGEAGRQELNDLRRLLFGITNKLVFNSLQPLNVAARAKKLVRAPVVGGNLTVLVSMFGTPWQPSGKGKILMIEDVGERGYRIDRMLVQLEQAGYFKGLRALIFGDFVGGDEGDCSYLWKDVQKNCGKEYKFPVLKGLPCGHTTMQRPLPLNTRSELQLGRQPKMTVFSGAQLPRRK